jgi:hypothetical protein
MAQWLAGRTERSQGVRRCGSSQQINPECANRDPPAAEPRATVYRSVLRERSLDNINKYKITQIRGSPGSNPVATLVLSEKTSHFGAVPTGPAPPARRSKHQSVQGRGMGFLSRSPGLTAHLGSLDDLRSARAHWPLPCGWSELHRRACEGSCTEATQALRKSSELMVPVSSTRIEV